MRNNLLIKVIVILLATTTFFSCSKKSDPTASQTCYLSSVLNSKGNVLEKFTYDSNNRLIRDASDSAGVSFDFAYNTQSLVNQITVTVKSATAGTYSYIVAFTYDASGKATKATVTVSGTVYQTNVFQYTGSQITKVTTTDYQSNLINTRFEYTGDNISKVYQQFDADKEYLYYEITKFDDKKNLYPPAYQALALGLTGLVDGFTYLNKNNAVSEKYYNENGTVGYTSDNTLEYNGGGLPTKLTASINSGGTKSTNVNSFEYTCK